MLAYVSLLIFRYANFTKKKNEIKTFFIFMKKMLISYLIFHLSHSSNPVKKQSLTIDLKMKISLLVLLFSREILRRNEGKKISSSKIILVFLRNYVSHLSAVGFTAWWSRDQMTFVLRLILTVKKEKKKRFDGC